MFESCIASQRLESMIFQNKISQEKIIKKPILIPEFDPI
jgi:hypothetical protein